MKQLRFPGRKASRKAQAETQLNWIFILIVGAIILAFFTYIVMKQKTSSEAKFAGKVSQQINTILVGAKVSSGTVQEIPTPELAIRFTCNDYYIGPASQRLGNRVVFAQENLEGTKLITWTLDWNVPFKVTSFLYMTTPNVRYVIVGNANDRAANELFSILPVKMNKELVATQDYPGSVRNEGDKYVRFIFVNSGTMFNIPVGFDNVEVSGLSIDTERGELQFLVRSVSDSESFTTSGPRHTYTEPEPLYGAVFMDKPEEYACLMKRAYTRLGMVTKVYAEKLNMIAPIYSGTSCEGYYGNNGDLKAIVDAVKSYPPSYGAIGTSRSNLFETNTRLQLQSCPLIY